MYLELQLVSIYLIYPKKQEICIIYEPFLFFIFSYMLKISFVVQSNYEIIYIREMLEFLFVSC
jgi:hypothetical protein